MYIVKFGKQNYYTFKFKTYQEAVRFLKVITDNGYKAMITTKEEEGT